MQPLNAFYDLWIMLENACVIILTGKKGQKIVYIIYTAHTVIYLFPTVQHICAF